jgi:hypothetical protein
MSQWSSQQVETHKQVETVKLSANHLLAGHSPAKLDWVYLRFLEHGPALNTGAAIPILIANASDTVAGVKSASVEASLHQMNPCLAGW